VDRIIFLIYNFLHSPVISSPFGPNILLSTLFSNSLSLRSSLHVRDQVSRPYRTTGNIIALYNTPDTTQNNPRYVCQCQLSVLYTWYTSRPWSKQETSGAKHNTGAERLEWAIVSLPDHSTAPLKHEQGSQRSQE
jgi:hypothetical protein